MSPDQVVAWIDRTMDACGQKASGNEAAVAIIEAKDWAAPGNRRALAAGLVKWVDQAEDNRFRWIRATIALMIRSELVLEQLLEPARAWLDGVRADVVAPRETFDGIARLWYELEGGATCGGPVARSGGSWWSEAP